MPHPVGSSVGSGKTLAIESWQFELFEKNSHTSLSPEQGINALDAETFCYQMINHQKAYYLHTNVQGIISEAGVSPRPRC